MVRDYDYYNNNDSSDCIYSSSGPRLIDFDDKTTTTSTAPRRATMPRARYYRVRVKPIQNRNKYALGGYSIYRIAVVGA